MKIYNSNQTNLTELDFTAEEREQIQQGLWQKKSLRQIAKELGRQSSSIFREIEKNLPPEHFLYISRLSHERALKKRKSKGRQNGLKNDVIRQCKVPIF